IRRLPAFTRTRSSFANPLRLSELATCCTAEKSNHRHRRLLRARRERPRGCRAAECGQQFPPSDGDCHPPLPREGRTGKDTTPRACCPNSAAAGEGGAHAGHRLQRSTAWPEDSGLISRDLSSAAPLHFVSEP